MRWKQFCVSIKSFVPEEVTKYISEHKEGTFTLLDVRQGWEFEMEHIPGARLIPLPEIIDSLADIDSKKPIIVYCNSGRRSRLATQILTGQGFTDAYNMEGGIHAWKDRVATGPVEEGMALLNEEETVEDIFILAYGMEEGLENFYRTMESKVKNEEVTDMFNKLTKIEEGHKGQVFRLYKKSNPSITDRASFEEKVVSKFMEGGLTIEEFLEINKPDFSSATDALELAMMIEAQALDLYMRYSGKVTDEESRVAFFELAEAEKSHLKGLGRLMNKMSPGSVNR